MKDLIKKQEEEFKGVIGVIKDNTLDFLPEKMCDNCKNTDIDSDDFKQWCEACGEETEIINFRDMVESLLTNDLGYFIKKVRKETAEAVCDKMIGKMRVPEYPLASRVLGYNQRIKEEKELKKQIIKDYEQHK